MAAKSHRSLEFLRKVRGIFHLDCATSYKKQIQWHFLSHFNGQLLLHWVVQNKIEPPVSRLTDLHSLNVLTSGYSPRVRASTKCRFVKNKNIKTHFRKQIIIVNLWRRQFRAFSKGLLLNCAGIMAFWRHIKNASIRPFLKFEDPSREAVAFVCIK